MIKSEEDSLLSMHMKFMLGIAIHYLSFMTSVDKIKPLGKTVQVELAKFKTFFKQDWL
jgi:hypothetical protein